MLLKDKKESFNTEKEKGKDYSAIIGIILFFSPLIVLLFTGNPSLSILGWVAFICFLFYHLIENTTEKKEKIGGWILLVIILSVGFYICLSAR